jgi:leucyl aminopeptidase
MAEQAAEVARARRLDIEVWDEEQLAERGLRRHRRGRQGSVNPPRLVRLDYAPTRGGRKARARRPGRQGHHLRHRRPVHQGRDNMMLMKRDMTGAGVVLAVMGRAGRRRLPRRVTGLLPLAENSVGAGSIRPGDVVRHYGGRTTEVTNTDAEGRLVIGDALAYAVADLEPDVLVDIATLTGAMKISLGQKTGGYFATDDALGHHAARRVAVRGRAAVADADRGRLRGADLLQGGRRDNAGGAPGAITGRAVPPALHRRAALGPPRHRLGRRLADDEFEYTKGATGFGPARSCTGWSCASRSPASST